MFDTLLSRAEFFLFVAVTVDRKHSQFPHNTFIFINNKSCSAVAEIAAHIIATRLHS